ncbi:MAG TPA: ATP-binding protein, partial [Longimicrobium sp.]
MREPGSESARGGEPARVDAAADRLFAGPGEMRARFRATAWADTPLGPVAGWPSTLRSAVRLMLAAPIATSLWCGPAYALLYNDGYARILGIKHPGALGRSGAEVWNELWPILEPQFAGVRQGGPAVFLEEALLVMERGAGGAGEDAWFTYSLSALTDEDGSSLAVHNVAVEITEKVRAREALAAASAQLQDQQMELEIANEQLQESAAELEAQTEELRASAAALEERTEEAEEERARATGILEEMADAHFALDSEFRITAVNTAMERGSGLPRAELLGRSFWEMFPGAVGTDFEHYYRRAATERVEGHFTHDYSDGRLDLVVEVDAYPARGGGIAVFWRDVTLRMRAAAERERLLRETEALRAEAEAANRTKSEFLATMSHELRTPINAILGYTDLLEGGIVGPVTERQRDHLGRIASSGRHLVGLVADILDLAKLDAGRLEVSRELGQVGHVVAAALPLVVPQAETKGITIEDRCSGDCDYTYIGDEDRIRQVLINLLSNAVKFTEPGGRIIVNADVTDRPDARAHLSSTGPWTCITVTDTGRGIAPEQIEAVFQPFVQAEAGHTRTQGGTGLGLTISRDLARLMGGDLTASSTLGEGATFTLWLPLSAQAAKAPSGRWLARAGEAIQADLDGIVSRFTARLRADPSIMVAHEVERVELEDHTGAFLADIAQALMILEEKGSQSDLMRDGSELQRLVSERHGEQRARLGWTEDDLRREYQILRDEVLASARRALEPGDGAADETIQAIQRMLGRAAEISLAG